VSTLIGYAWVSTDGEAFDLQKEALDRAGVDLLFADVASTADAERPQLKQVIERLDEGDTLVVWRLDRLGPSLEHLIETIDRLGRRGIGFRSLEEEIDITAGASEPAFRVVAALAQFRRDFIREQTTTGRAKTPAPGRRRGRRFKLDKQKQALAVMLYKDQRNSVAAVCRRFRIGRTTLYRYVAESD
jgi:DNA invertase Pin-like site-specific DNA recombinase